MYDFLPKSINLCTYSLSFGLGFHEEVPLVIITSVHNIIAHTAIQARFICFGPKRETINLSARIRNEKGKFEGKNGRYRPQTIKINVKRIRYIIVM